MGTHSGRDEYKVKGAALIPVPMGGSVRYKEAQPDAVYVCRRFELRNIHGIIYEEKFVFCQFIYYSNYYAVMFVWRSGKRLNGNF